MAQDESENVQGRGDPEARAVSRPSSPLPPAGPHAEPALTNPDATPGTGALPPVGPTADPNMQSTG